MTTNSPIRVQVQHLNTRVILPLSLRALQLFLRELGYRNHHPRDQDQSGHNRGMTLRSGPVCAYCKRRGHLLSECWVLERKDKKKGNALVTTSGHSSRKVAAKTPDTFKPFLSQGSVSIEENGVGKSIQILRDTGASQSFAS